jgi:hypothetical protein
MNISVCWVHKKYETINIPVMMLQLDKQDNTIKIRQIIKHVYPVYPLVNEQFDPENQKNISSGFTHLLTPKNAGVIVLIYRGYPLVN